MPLVAEKTAPLERKKRFSRSILWKFQRSHFERHGIEPWSNGVIPHHITSSPFIATAFSKVAFHFLRDCYVFPKADPSIPPLDPSQPIYLVELGSGAGRFAYLFLREFPALQRDSALKEIPIKYVMTDFAARNLEFWRAHPWFQSFVDAGLLDFARFDVERDRQLKLIHSNETVSAKTLRNPLIVIANYLFDSIPQDAFFIWQGELFETLVTLTRLPRQEHPDDPDPLSRVEMLYDYRRVDGNYYRDASWNRLLLDYKRRFNDCPFLFPTAALQCVQNLYRLSRGRMLLLSGDRGYSSDAALLEGKGAPTMAVHGSISMMVDYQIIGEYCRQLGGQVLHPAHRAQSLNISAFIFGDSPGDFSETRQAYTDAIDKFGPDDFFTLKEGVAQVYDALTLDQLLAFLRLSCWDYKRFCECLPVLKKQLLDITDRQKHELYEVILKVWDSYLPIGEDTDVAFELGTLLLEMDLYAEALEFLQRSVELYGIAPGTAYNIGVAYYGVGQMEQAREYFEQAVELDPQFVEAKAMRKALLSARATGKTIRSVRRNRQLVESTP